MDGNFVSQHLKMRNPEDDVSLSDGHGYMVTLAPYQAHIKAATDTREVGFTCCIILWPSAVQCMGIDRPQNVMIIAQSMVSTVHMQKILTPPESVQQLVDDTAASSLILWSIFRRGNGECICFLPTAHPQTHGFCSHMNMDYSFTQALSRCKDNKRVCHYYDINCSYWENFIQRCTENDFLHLPPDMEFFRGIGLFHVHGHQNQCFMRFAPSFIPGAGMIDGEIIETLWVGLNEIGASTRNMSWHHRQETMDLHMNDSNWKKLVNMSESNSRALKLRSPCLTPRGVVRSFLIVPSLTKKWKDVHRGVKDSADAYEAIESITEDEVLESWLALEADAQARRWEDKTAMDIYDVQADQGQTI